MLNHRELTIAPSIDGQGKITGFTIRTNTGVTYTFISGPLRTKTARKRTTVPTVLRSDYIFYATPASYLEDWPLSTIVSGVTGASATFTYTSDTQPPADAVKQYVKIEPNNQVDTIYSVIDSYTAMYLNQITLGTYTISLSRFMNRIGKVTISESSSGQIREFEFIYHNVYSVADSYPQDRLDFLREVRQTSACAPFASYKFSYQDVNLSSNTIAVPWQRGWGQDWFGFYNGVNTNQNIPTIYYYNGESGSRRFRTTAIPGQGATTVLTGFDRAVNENYSSFGAVTRIDFPTGGYTTISYEPNKYYDASTNEELGRFGQIDPKAAKYSFVSPYNYSLNNPVNINDPLGDDVWDQIRRHTELITAMHGGGGSSTYQGYGVGWGNQNDMYGGQSTGSLSSFMSSAFASENGGTWTNGFYEMFESRHQAFEVGVEYANYHAEWVWIPYGGEEISRDEWLRLGGNKEKTADHYYPGAWERRGAKKGDPNLESFVNPLSFNLSNVFGRYVTYVDYDETYSDVFDPLNLKTFDQMNIKLERIALSIRAKDNNDPKVLFKLAMAFDKARFKLFDEFDKRSIFNMMTDGEGEALFMKYLNMSLQIYFPSPTTFARLNHHLLSVGDPPSSKITFIGPFYNPN